MRSSSQHVDLSFYMNALKHNDQWKFLHVLDCNKRKTYFCVGQMAESPPASFRTILFVPTYNRLTKYFLIMLQIYHGRSVKKRFNGIHDKIITYVNYKN